jgi:methionyl-tRNA formyltransferase
MKIDEPVVFFGTGPVAAASLRLLAKDFPIEAVITKPALVHHKEQAPVLAAVEELGLKVLAASNRDELGKLFAKKPVKSRLGILIDFGIIISQSVIDYFPLGIINSHFSILPEWRGADPISFAILSGQKDTGVSLMLLTAGLDEGPLLAFSTYELLPDITGPLLTEHLIDFSHVLLQRTVPEYLAAPKRGAPQNITGRQVSYSRKLTKADGIIDWKKPAVELEREIRAYAEWPRSRTKLGSVEVVITNAHVVKHDGASRIVPGRMRVEGKKLLVETGKDLLSIVRLIPVGKKEMTIEAFLAGYAQSLKSKN